MVALYIILGVILLLFLISLIKIELFLSYENEVALKIKVLFVQIKILPKDKNKKPKKKKVKKKKTKTVSKEAEEEKPKEKKKQSVIGRLKEKHGLPGLISLLLDLVKIATSALKGIFSHIVMQSFNLQINLVSEDAAATALNYGKLCGVVYPAVTTIANITNFKDYHLYIKPDFTAENTKIYFSMNAYIRICHILSYGIVAGVKLLFKYLKNR